MEVPLRHYPQVKKYSFKTTIIISLVSIPVIALFLSIFLYIILTFNDLSPDDIEEITIFAVYSTPFISFMIFLGLNRKPIGVDIYQNKLVISIRETQTIIPRSQIRKIKASRYKKSTQAPINMLSIKHQGGKIRIDSFSTTNFQSAINDLEAWWNNQPLPSSPDLHQYQPTQTISPVVTVQQPISQHANASSNYAQQGQTYQIQQDSHVPASSNCPRCGVSNASNLNYCPMCLFKIASNEKTQPAAQTQPAPTVAVQPSPQTVVQTSVTVADTPKQSPGGADYQSVDKQSSQSCPHCGFSNMGGTTICVMCMGRF